MFYEKAQKELDKNFQPLILPSLRQTILLGLDFSKKLLKKRDKILTNQELYKITTLKIIIRICFHNQYNIKKIF